MEFRSLSRAWIAAALLVVCSPTIGLCGQSNSLLDISTDGTLLACSNRDSGTVTILSLPDGRKLQEVAVGRHPEGVSFVGESHKLTVAIYDDDALVLLDADSGTLAGRVEVFDEPYGVVSTREGTLFVTLDYPGEVVEVDPEQLSIRRTIPAGKFLRGIALTPDEKKLLVTEYYTGVVRAFDRTAGTAVDEWTGASTENLARQIVVHPTSGRAFLPHIRSRITAAHGAGSIFPYVSVVKLSDEKGDRRKRIAMDSFLGATVTANPWEVAISPDGRRAYVLFSGTDDMFVSDVREDSYSEIEFREYLRLGHNPRAVCVSPDSQMFFVYNALDFRVVAYDAKTLKPVWNTQVCNNPLPEDVLRGKILFYVARQPMSLRKWISCSSCHPDGQPDGRTWQNPEGLRNTQALAGMAWTHPIHWSADRDEVQDFEHTIRGPLMQGEGLIADKVQPALEQPNAGLSADLDALAAYSNSHRFTLSPHAKGGLSPEAARGKEIFFSKETGCATCHSGPMYTDSTTRTEFLMHDVGTGGDDPSELMGPKYDTPTLLGLYRTAPYLHHGRAQTLEDVLTVCNKDDRHGKTSHLKSQDIADLVAFLKALPYEDPEAAATAAGLTRVGR